MMDAFVDWWILTLLKALVWCFVLTVKLIFNKYVLALFLTLVVFGQATIGIATLLGLMPDEDDAGQD
ncbi:MAG: hypothetical protein D6761_13805 [Candidatus Dadabacteria bacterium]|nr:MAG: hypothetical protein D6761_13805 [Candidatus Dadabacteria bacterium]